MIEIKLKMEKFIKHLLVFLKRHIESCRFLFACFKSAMSKGTINTNWWKQF